MPNAFELRVLRASSQHSSNVATLLGTAQCFVVSALKHEYGRRDPFQER